MPKAFQDLNRRFNVLSAQLERIDRMNRQALAVRRVNGHGYRRKKWQKPKKNLKRHFNVISAQMNSVDRMNYKASGWRFDESMSMGTVENDAESLKGPEMSI